MEYQALYRRYRPQRFDEIVGQDHVTRTLAHEVVEGKVAHAYLFAGPRGTGKTTTARVLAKALNCPDRGADGEPCNVCASCAGIASGSSLDVIELDAASHNKVEDIREIRMNVGTVAAAGGAHKVYILDEAHMLSRAAGNALLKTLEEPPEHVIFVLATTEPYKLLDTIRSRSQRFDFHPVSPETLVAHLKDISQRESYRPDVDALSLVATHSGGSVRDAMSLLEQVAALGQGAVESASVSRALGLADREAFGLLSKAIAEGDASAALGIVAKVASDGSDLRRFVAEGLSFFRGLFLAHYAPNLEEVSDEPEDVRAEWRRYAGIVSPGDVLRAVDQLGEALLQLRQGREERLVVEIAMLRLTRPETAMDTAAFNERLSRLEDRVRRLTDPAPAMPSTSPPPSAPPATKAAVQPPVGEDQAQVTVDDAGQPPVLRVAPVPEDAVDEQTPAGSGEGDLDAPTDAPFATPEAVVADAPAAVAAAPTMVSGLDVDTFSTSWPAIVARLRDFAGPRRHALIREATPVRVEGSTVHFEVPPHLPFHLEQLQHDDELHGFIREVAVDILGGAIRVAFAAGSSVESVEVAESKVPDKAALAEDHESSDSDPAGMVVDLLGGEVVSD